MLGLDLGLLLSFLGRFLLLFNLFRLDLGVLVLDFESGKQLGQGLLQLRDLAVRHLQFLDPILQPLQFVSELARLLR